MSAERTAPLNNPERVNTVAPSYSVVIPTYQRRDLVVSAVRALSRQDMTTFEVIVVIDGSTDGTADALKSLDTPFQLTIIEQKNSGAAKARNRGAAVARGQIILFLDDDMEADPGIIRAHDEEYQNNADAVVGHIPLHPDTPRSVLADGTARWASNRASRLEAASGVVTIDDIVTGQLSIRAEVFMAIGKFDDNFTREGSFGNEDVDLGQRLLEGDYRVVYCPKAVSWQRYCVSPDAFLRQSRQLGRADVMYVRKHPSSAERINRERNAGAIWNRYAWRPLSHIPVLSAAVAMTARQIVFKLAYRDIANNFTGKAFALVRDLEYWRGVHEAENLPTGRSIRVLCYHSISDLADAPVISEYGVPADEFRRQLGILRRAGFNFVSFDEVMRYLNGSVRLPSQPVLVTFDDCFVNLLENGLPVLQQERVPAVAFAVAGLIGETNSWDTAIGAPTLRLLDGEGLVSLEAAGVEIGVHGRTHRRLRSVSNADLQNETVQAAEDLRKLGLSNPRVFAYPHGDQNVRVRQAVSAAGFCAAFTVVPGVVQPRSDRFALRRIEVKRRDGAGIRFVVKVALAGMPLRAHAYRVGIVTRRLATVVAHCLHTGRRA
jgi:GT2 family glycosyltransferase/peptidoglycan/xylan/chitin deacetylase (PgdA/CDA1 family)